MSTLASSFLNDLAGLSDDEDDILGLDGLKEEADEEEFKPQTAITLLLEPVVNAVVQYITEANSTGQFVVTDFCNQPKIVAVRKQAEERIHHPMDANIERDLLKECSDLILELDREIVNVSRFISDIYGCQFPELASIVGQSPVEYIQLVKRARFEMDFTKVDMNDLLPNQVQVAVQVAASMATGDGLGVNEMNRVMTACDEGMELMELREIILSYIEERMDFIAPNVSICIGKSLAARLITLAEGLQNLAGMPSQNLILLGTDKKVNSTGGATTSAMKNRGILAQSDLFMNTPPAFQTRAIRLLSGKISLAARVDASGSARDGSKGQMFREQIIKALQKSQQPPPAPLKRPLPKPKEGGGKSTKRGGRRIRKLKEKLGMTRLAKQHNRVTFGAEEDDKGEDFVSD